MFTQEAIRKEYRYCETKGELVRLDCDKRRESHKRKSRYHNVQVNGQALREHRAIWIWHNGAIPDGMNIDHKDGNTHNNRIENLRLCSKSENCRNRKVQKNNASGFKGVHKSGNQYAAVIYLNNKANGLGRYATAIDAAKAYDAAALKYHGEFARTNASMGLL